MMRLMHPPERAHRCVECGEVARWVNEDGDHYCDMHWYPDPWGPGGKFVESGLRRVEGDED